MGFVIFPHELFEEIGRIVLREFISIQMDLSSGNWPYQQLLLIKKRLLKVSLHIFSIELSVNFS